MMSDDSGRSPVGLPPLLAPWAYSGLTGGALGYVAARKGGDIRLIWSTSLPEIRHRVPGFSQNPAP